MAMVLQQIPSYQTSAHRRYANVNSRIDQSDPNPAHQLQRSLEELNTDSKQGRETSPRFSTRNPVKVSRPSFQRQATYSEGYPSITAPKRRSPLAEFRKAASVDSPFITKPTKSKLASSFPRPVKRERASKICKMSTLSESSPTQSPITRHQGFDDIREDEEEMGAAIASELSSNASETANSKAFTVSDVAEDCNARICGMEVVNNDTETTVVLQHLLALSGKNSSHTRNSNMAIIEEDEVEEDYYESEDTPASVKSPHLFSLPHPIPQLVITDENGQLVETVVQNSREYSDIAAQYSVTLPGQYSVTLPGLLEEEDEPILATRL